MRGASRPQSFLSGLVAWQFSSGGVFLQVPAIAGLAAITAMTIPYSKVDLRRARGLEAGDGHTEAPQGWMTLLRSRPLLVFAACSFLYEWADAPLLTLVGQKLSSDWPGAGIMLTSALIVASQAGMLADIAPCRKSAPKRKTRSPSMGEFNPPLYSPIC